MRRGAALRPRSKLPPLRDTAAALGLDYLCFRMYSTVLWSVWL